jgi:predicted TIM-barrel fold metal-dependent hydrolase
MADATIIDALFCIPKSVHVRQVADCVPFTEDLAPLMQSAGIGGAVLGPCNCAQCQHQWNCADRCTHEAQMAAAQNPKLLRGLASYDPLRIGESLRWIDGAVSEGALAGAYVQAECCVSGLDASRMYPLYGLCAMLRAPLVMDFTNGERWLHHRPEVEVVAADFPELEILLATPQRTGAASIVQLMDRFPNISVLLHSESIQSDAKLCEYVELHGRERALFRSSPKGWPESVRTALSLPLGATARRAYLSENAARLFHFSVEALRAA